MGRYYETFDPPFFMERRYAYNAIAVNPYNFDRPDEDIVADLRRRLNELRPLDTSRVYVSCEHNRVVLRGLAPTEAAKQFFERIADRILGVRAVENKMTVHRPGAKALVEEINLEPFTGWTESQEKPVDDFLL